MPESRILLDILVLLVAALVMGTLAERVRQSAVLGYLVAGTLVGPNVLGLVGGSADEGTAAVHAIAELGVSVLLFTIGLEFSFPRLRRMGSEALIAGGFQVVGTAIAAAVAASLFGLDLGSSIALGAMIALSSTACVLRLLVDRNAIDSLHGRRAVGILLIQDLAVIPLILLVSTTSGTGTLGDSLIALGRTVLLGALLVTAFVLISRHVIPRVLDLQAWTRSRELPILLAIVMALGSAYAAHAASLSPAVGAFVAGVLLGESPFSTQIRADVSSLRTLLVTLFFVSIGMLGDPAWVLENWGAVLVLVTLIMTGKTVIIWAIVRSMGLPHGVALATGLCLAQVGEFSFVLAETVREPAGTLSNHLFNLIVSATIVTLIVTPFLVALAARVAGSSGSARRAPQGGEEEAREAPAASTGILIVGFGPAGQAVSDAFAGQHRDRIAVVELNPRTAAIARRAGLRAQIGDATQRDVLEHAGLATARVVVITIPDPNIARTVIHVVRRLAPGTPIVVRSRYHVRRWELELAGAREVVDEEAHVGLRMAALARRHFHPQTDEPSGPDA